MDIAVVASLFVFVTVTAAAIALLRWPVAARVSEQRFLSLNAPAVPTELEAGEVLRRGASSFPFLRHFLTSSPWSEQTAIRLQQAGFRLKVSEYLMIRLLAAGLCALLPLFILRGQGVSALLAPLFALSGFMLPALVLYWRKEQRIALVNRQLVEALQLISNAMRSGFAFTQAVENATRQLAPPLQDEFHQFLHDVRLGARLDDALLALSSRTGSYDLDMVVTAILVQRTSGGNLSEILDNVTETMRERDRIRGEIRSLTAHQRLTGLILSVYPVLLGLIFFALAPSQMSLLFTETLGRVLLGIALGLQTVGALAIRRLLVIDI
ncbi:MAG TPA: type II secretion system F family protein [Dehalococcoidia bacterium]|nr:type II secretion system F family protein [Dehalococcoidia bacterium]